MIPRPYLRRLGRWRDTDLDWHERYRFTTELAHARRPPLPEDQASRHVTLPLDAMTDMRSDARDSSIKNVQGAPDMGWLPLVCSRPFGRISGDNRPEQP